MCYKSNTTKKNGVFVTLLAAVTKHLIKVTQGKKVFWGSHIEGSAHYGRENKAVGPRDSCSRCKCLQEALSGKCWRAAHSLLLFKNH